jgi:hypothetical protein
MKNQVQLIAYVDRFGDGKLRDLGRLLAGPLADVIVNHVSDRSPQPGERGAGRADTPGVYRPAFHGDLNSALEGCGI